MSVAASADPPLHALGREVLEQPAQTRRMVVIVNPFASSVDARLRRLVVAALASRFDVEAVDTDAPGHATGLAGAAARNGADVVVTLGGGGTVKGAPTGRLGPGVPPYPPPATGSARRL